MKAELVVGGKFEKTFKRVFKKNWIGEILCSERKSAMLDIRNLQFCNYSNFKK